MRNLHMAELLAVNAKKGFPVARDRLAACQSEKVLRLAKAFATG